MIVYEFGGAGGGGEGEAGVLRRVGEGAGVLLPPPPHPFLVDRLIEPCKVFASLVFTIGNEFRIHLVVLHLVF